MRARARPQTLPDLLGVDEDTTLEFLWSLREQAYPPTGLSTPELARLSEEEQRRELARERLAVAEAAYHAEKNPIHAWLAWALCRSAGIGIPDWVANYFDRVASAIERLAVRTPKKPAAALAGALEMKRAGQSGRGTVFARFQRFDMLLAAINFRPYLDEYGKAALAASELEKSYRLSAALANVDLAPHAELLRNLRGRDLVEFLEQLARGVVAKPAKSAPTILRAHRAYRRQV